MQHVQQNMLVVMVMVLAAAVVVVVTVDPVGAERVTRQTVPESWTCESKKYDDGKGCHCGCGAPDPDCDNSDLPLRLCKNGYDRCSTSGVCIPKSWTGKTSQYATGGACHCNKGAYDPDCADKGARLTGCKKSENKCSKSGVCVPKAWTCSKKQYVDGRNCHCNCGVGALDPDCLDTSLPVKGCTVGTCSSVGTCVLTGGGSGIPFVSGATKGLNIDDVTASYAPSATNPAKSSDTFPYAWPTTDPTALANRVQSIRTFHYSTGAAASAWVKWAVKNNVKVIVGITLATADTELDQFSNDYLAKPSLQALFDQNVIAIAVGNENDMSEATLMAQKINAAKALISAKKLPKVPVTTVLKYDTNWITPGSDYPPGAATFTPTFIATIAPVVDFVAFNLYGIYFSHGNNPPLTPQQALDQSMSWISDPAQSQLSIILNQMAAVRYAMINAGISSKEFWATEVGWQSEYTGSETFPDWSSQPYLQEFYRGFAEYDMSAEIYTPESSPPVASPDHIFYFTTRDVPAMKEAFGLFTTQESPLVPKVL